MSIESFKQGEANNNEKANDLNKKYSEFIQNEQSEQTHNKIEVNNLRSLFKEYIKYMYFTLPSEVAKKLSYIFFKD